MRSARITEFNAVRWLRQGLLLLLLCWLLPAWSEPMQVVDRIEVDTAGIETRVKINFNVPLQYINHAPQTHGDKIILQLRPVVLPQTTDIDFAQPESLNWEPIPGVPLQFVRYEGGSSQRVQIGVSFRGVQDFEVQPSSDARSITIILPKTEQPTAPQPPAPAPTPAPEPGAVVAPPEGQAEPPEIPGRYVLNLESSIQPIALPEPGGFDVPGPLLLYSLQSTVEGRVWNRIRVGFFETQEAAQAVQARLKARYPRIWIVAAGEDERREAQLNGVVIGAARAPLAEAPATGQPPVGKPKPEAEAQPSLPALPKERLDALMEEARQAMAKGDHARAIQIYTKVLQHADTGMHQDAQEFLGLARERNNQLAFAKLEYERYLERYPQGPGAERVRQRLAGLTTARLAPKEKRRTPGRKREEEQAWDVFGSFSQFYRRNTSSVVEEDPTANTRDEETTVNQSSLSNDLDITGRRRGGNLEIETRFSGGYEVDFLDEDEGTGDISRVSSMYADFQDRNRGLGGRFGRQTRSTGGVLGRFDGGLLSYQWKPTVKLNAVTGYPVDSSKDNLETSRYFYGLSADFGTYANAWDFVAFMIEQQVDEILDRRAVGGEARYFDPAKSLITYVDYDVSYAQLNTFLMLGNWNLPNQITVNATVDIRQSPILTTRNAIQGQTVDTIDALRATYSEDEIRSLAEDRTADSQTYTVGLSRQLNEMFQLTGDVTMSKFGETPASGGVEAIPSTGNEFFYNLQLIGSNLLKANDIAILGVRYQDTSTSDTKSLLLNERYPINKAWRVNPRFRVDYRTNKDDDTNQWIYAPSIVTDYLWRKRYRFELETGGEWSQRQLTTTNEDTSSYFVYVGYRADFR